MPYQNDMSTLADVVGPAYAAQQAGIQNDAANQEAQAHADVATGTVPADIEAAGLKNLFTQAQTAQQQATTQGTDLGNIKTAGTLGSDIGLTNAKNATGITQQHVDRLQQAGQIAATAAASLDGVSPLERPMRMQTLVQNMGIDPQLLGPLMNGDPDQLRNFSQKMIQGSQDFQTKLMQGNLRNQGSLDVATENNSGKVQAATITAQARLQGQQLVAQIKQQQQTFEQAAVAAQKRGDTNTYNMMSDLALKSRQAAAGITSQLVTGQPLQIPQMEGGQGGDGGGGAPSVPTPLPGGTDAMTTAAKQAWPNDDPSKYDYRIGADGNIQRKAK